MGKEMTKTKEQLEEEKKIALSIRIKPLQLDAMDTDDLKAKATELFNIVIQLETDKYDYEQKKVNQERDLQELKERQKAQLRQKALKKGLDPEALVGKYPPPIRMYSKYERRTDTRTYEDRKKLYEGGWEVIRAESLDAIWKEKYDEWSKRPAKRLPSGLVRGQARRLEMPRLPRVRRLRRPRLLRRRRSLRKRRRRRKRRSKLILLEVKQLLSPKNIPDWFLFFLESQRFAVLKTKWLCIFYVTILDFYGFLWISMDFLCKTILDFFLSPVTNKINTLGMEA